MEQASISVIVPIYNTERYLNDCITSIVQQTAPNLEIILVDDGSPDRCGDMCDEWAKKDTRIRVLHQKNLGVSAARNAGIQAANGDLISFVDADDVLPCDAYEHFLSSMDNSDLVMGRMQRIDESGAIYGTASRIPSNGTSVELFLIDLFQEKKYSYLGYLCDKLFRKSIIIHNGIRFNEEIKLNEDRLFLLEYLLHCYIVTFCDYTTYYYRQHNESAVMLSQRSPSISDNKMTVIDSFRSMASRAKEHSEELYYNVSRKSFECALDLMKQICINKSYRKQIRTFKWESVRACLKNPTCQTKDKLIILTHGILNR